MADFEGLINQALARHDSSNLAVREKIYQSSRNALVKMLEKTGNLSDDAVSLHFGKLEQSIARIEASYANSAKAPPVQTREQPLSGHQAPAVKSTPVSVPHVEPSVPRPNLQQAGVRHPQADEQTVPVPQSYQPAMDQQQAEVSFGKAVVPQDKMKSVEPAPATIQTSQAVKTDSVSDVMAELEALFPKAYAPSPLFPAPAAPNGQATQTAPTGFPAGSGQAFDRPDTAPVPVAVRQPLPQRTEPSFRPAQLDIPAGGVEESAVSQANEDNGSYDLEPPEKVSSYLGDVAAEAERQETPEDTSHHFEVEAEPLRTYKRRNPLLRRIWPIFLALAVVLVILWILYALFTTMNETDNSPAQQTGLGPVGETQEADDGSVFITLLEPTDLSSLVTAGRGTAELLNQQNRQMLRLQSVRQGALAAGNAEPILLELEKGVLNQISGKEVTVELFAKSGLNGPAQFAVECDIAGDSVCGRKRFLVGVQPERIVFALDLTGGIAPGARAFLAINTDITNTADASGTGDAIDIIYVRLRLPDEPK